MRFALETMLPKPGARDGAKYFTIQSTTALSVRQVTASPYWTSLWLTYTLFPPAEYALFSSIVTLLEASHLAKPFGESREIWSVSSSWRRGNASDQLLAEVISNLLAGDRPCFLASGGEIDWKQLGSKPWNEEANKLWRVPADLDGRRFVETSFHSEGNYGLFVCASKANVEAIPDLPWWGFVKSESRAARILEGLHEARVDAALMVHADASDWIVAIPNGPNLESKLEQMLIVLQDEPGLFVFPTIEEAHRSIEVYDAASIVRAAFDDRAIPYRVEWVRPQRRRKRFFGLLSFTDPGEYRFIAAGPPDPDALAKLLAEHPEFTNPPEAKADLSRLLSTLRHASS